MSRKQKYILGFAILFIGMALKLPIWKIDIWAPQYPEGLSMQIFAERIEGNVDQINILNHYIGMKHIQAEKIPEFSLIPWILGGAIMFGILIIISNRIFLAKIWLILLGVFSISGLVDFYLWIYDYGHNLNPDAPIKIPGFTYQPPLFGYKKILNIETYSLPDWGAYAIGVGILLAFCSIYWTLISESQWSKLVVKKFFVFLLPVSLISCTVHPDALVIGEDHCDNCHMLITDTRFGAEAITEKGRVYKFDSIRCLQEYLTKHNEKIKKTFVTDYFHPKTLIEADTAFFLSGSNIAGPMGTGPIATKDKAAIEKLKTQALGKVTDWKELSQSSL